MRPNEEHEPVGRFPNGDHLAVDHVSPTEVLSVGLHMATRGSLQEAKEVLEHIGIYHDLRKLRGLE